MTAASSSVLTQPLLERCRERAPGYDRDNTFCLEDFNELKAAGYLKMAIPKEFGGLAMTLAQVSRETRLLAQYAPDLPGLFIVSEVRLNSGDGLAVTIDRADGVKCERCWKYTTDVGAHPEFPTICGSCSDAVTEILKG